MKIFLYSNEESSVYVWKTTFAMALRSESVQKISEDHVAATFGTSEKRG